jgi:hypothetical protein
MRYFPRMLVAAPLKAKQSLRVAVRDFGKILRAYRKGFQEGLPGGIRAEGVVDRIYQAIHAHDLQGTEKWGSREVSAGGHMNMFMEGVGDAAFEMAGHALKHCAGPG